MEVPRSLNELFSDQQADLGSLSDELGGIELGNNCLQDLGGGEGRGGEGRGTAHMCVVHSKVTHPLWGEVATTTITSATDHSSHLIGY